jgi:hypothetical protein
MMSIRVDQLIERERLIHYSIISKDSTDDFIGPMAGHVITGSAGIIFQKNVNLFKKKILKIDRQ